MTELKCFIYFFVFRGIVARRINKLLKVVFSNLKLYGIVSVCAQVIYTEEQLALK